MEEREYGGFVFRKRDERARGLRSGKLLGPPIHKLMDKGYFAKYRGALLTLFGEPNEQSRGADEAFDYFIDAKDQDGNVSNLTAYSGASGPAIGGSKEQPTSEDAAHALLKLIETTAPADYEATIYDDDTDNTVWYGIKDGQPFYEERPGKHIE